MNVMFGNFIYFSNSTFDYLFIQEIQKLMFSKYLIIDSCLLHCMHLILEKYHETETGIESGRERASALWPCDLSPLQRTLLFPSNWFKRLHL